MLMVVIMMITVLWHMMSRTFHSGLNVYSCYVIFKKLKKLKELFLKHARI